MFFTFRKMISPILIQILFWIAIVFFIYIAIFDIRQNLGYFMAIEILILGPLVARVVCELLILFFRINDNLVQIKTNIATD